MEQLIGVPADPESFSTCAFSFKRFCEVKLYRACLPQGTAMTYFILPFKERKNSSEKSQITVK